MDEHHRIESFRFILETPDGIDTHELQNIVSRSFQDQLHPQLSQLLSEASQGHACTLDTLEVDLGSIDINQLEHELPERAVQAIRAQLRQSIQVQSVPPSRAAPSQTLRTAIYLIENAATPWWAPNAHLHSLGEWILDAMNDAPTALLEYLNENLQHQKVRTRFTQALTPKQREKFYKRARRQSSSPQHQHMIDELELQLETPLPDALEKLRDFLWDPPQSIYPSQLKTLIAAAAQTYSKQSIRQLLALHLSSASRRHAIVERLPQQALEEIIRQISASQSHSLIQQTLTTLELIQDGFKSHESHLRSARHSLWSLSILRILETGTSHYHLHALLDAFPSHHSIDRKTLIQSVSRSLEYKEYAFPPDLVEQVEEWLSRQPELCVEDSSFTQEKSYIEESISTKSIVTPNSPYQKRLLQQLDQLFKTLTLENSPLLQEKVQTSLRSYKKILVERPNTAENIIGLYQEIATAHGISLDAILRFITEHNLPEPLRTLHTAISSQVEPSAPAASSSLQRAIEEQAPESQLKQILTSLEVEHLRHALQHAPTWNAFLNAPIATQITILSSLSPPNIEFYQKYLPQLWSLKQNKSSPAKIPASKLYHALMKAMFYQPIKQRSTQKQQWQEVLTETQKLLPVSNATWQKSIRPWIDHQLDPHAVSTNPKQTTQTQRDPLLALDQLIETLEQGKSIDHGTLASHTEQALLQAPRQLKEHIHKYWFRSKAWRLVKFPKPLASKLIDLLAPSQQLTNLYTPWKQALNSDFNKTILSETDFLNSTLHCLIDSIRTSFPTPSHAQLVESLAEQLSDNESYRKRLVQITSDIDTPNSPPSSQAAETVSKAVSSYPEGSIEAVDSTQPPLRSQPNESPSDTPAMVELWAQMLEKLWEDDPMAVIQHLGDAILSGNHSEQSLKTVPLALVRDYIATIYPHLTIRMHAILDQLAALQLANNLPGIDNKKQLDAILSYTLLLALNAKRRSTHHCESLTHLIVQALADVEGTSLTNYSEQLLVLRNQEKQLISNNSELFILLEYFAGKIKKPFSKKLGDSLTSPHSPELVTILCLTQTELITIDERKLTVAIHSLNYAETHLARQQLFQEAASFLQQSRILNTRCQMDILNLLAPKLQPLFQAAIQRLTHVLPIRSKQELSHLALRAVIEKPDAELRIVLTHYFNLLGQELDVIIPKLLKVELSRPKAGNAELDLWLYAELEANKYQTKLPKWKNFDKARQELQIWIETTPESLHSIETVKALTKIHQLSNEQKALVRDLQRILIATSTEKRHVDFSPLTLSLLQESLQKISTNLIGHAAQLRGGESHDWIEQHWQTIQEISPSFENPCTLRQLHRVACNLLPDRAISLPNLPGSIPTHFKQIPAEPNMLQRESQKEGTPAPVVTEIERDVWLIENAGLALFAPYIEMLIDRAGLLEHRAFPTSDHAIQAVFLLQHVITSEYKANEPELLLNRIICNLPLEQPLPRSVEPDPSWPELVAGLKTAVIHHWSTIGDTSHEGLIQTFVKRSGSLRYEQEDGWSLHVDSGPYDMLLESLPWAISKIHLPWMHEAIRVEWI
ncbi:contractile injection system tape measure protein [Rubritalea spongiae]|uniref:Contractile injection system tape measure protein n=1 Tax=Rubritalea spongiae TaxID=430797 RepID=A0ABW5E0K0_9BACT